MSTRRLSIDGFHVEGFGTLIDVGQSGLSSGFVVVSGPNEAGKSTLRDFLTGTLFGYATRRDDARFHAVVGSARRGGRVVLLEHTVRDPGGVAEITPRHFNLERIAGSPGHLRVRGPADEELGGSDLEVLLGGASQKLFDAVFAVDLDDLGRADAIGEQEVRALLFSTSILGQRRSASAAVAALQARRELLARPRQADALANRLQRDLEEIDGQVAAAKAEAGRFPARATAAAELERAVEDARAKVDEVAASRRQIATLRNLHVTLMRKRDAEAELAELAELDAVGSWLVDHALAIGDLATELSGHLERQGQLSKRRDSREEIDRSIEAKLDQVGSGFDRSRLREMSGWIERDAELQALLEAIERAKGALHVAEGTLAEADRRGASARAAADRAARAAVAEPGGDGRQGDRRGDDEHVELSAGEIAERLGLVSSLRLNLNEKRELEAVAAAELARRDRARDLPRAHGPLVTALLVLVVLALGAGAAVSVHRPLVLLICAVSLVFAAVALGVVVLDVWRPGAGRGGRGPSSLDQGDADSRPVGSPAGRTRRVDEKIADLATRLGLPTQPSQSDVESLDRALRPALDERRALEAALGIAAEETAAILVAREERDARARDLEGALGDLDQWARKLGLAGSLAPATVVATVQALKEARAELRRLDGIERSIAERAPHVEQFDKRLAELLATRPTLAPEHVDSAPEHTEPAPPPLDAEATVRRLDEDLKAARSLSSERAGLGSVASEASAQLASQLRSGEDSESLRVALEKGSPEEWEEADSALVEEGAAASAELEDAVRAHENALAALGELASSDRIAELELRRSGLEADLDRALCSWAELSCARSLISRTLAWHESQRQPAVLARAGEHFSKVTSGRYLRLLPSLEERTQSIRAQLASGGEIDAAKLSRGTVEQLYLCLRLGLAESFAERAVALPLILDDVLVNFDPSRAEATVQALQETAARHQVILLTCHPHIVDLVRAAEPEVQVVELLPG